MVIIMIIREGKKLCVHRFLLAQKTLGNRKPYVSQAKVHADARLDEGSCKTYRLLLS